jgi:hypothetical protein
VNIEAFSDNSLEIPRAGARRADRSLFAELDPIIFLINLYHPPLLQNGQDVLDLSVATADKMGQKVDGDFTALLELLYNGQNQC